MATIKAIEGRSVHQIQSGQVIVDLCSVAKELVENCLDAGATSIEVRFKNNGLDSIEVQDNGAGISPADYDTIALKHYTSKLSTYDDLTSLQTFGFRGEALSSLCALSKFHIITAQAADGAKGTKLEFEVSGKLKGTSVVAAKQGTTVVVETLFNNLPVRRKELEKSIKREYNKVLHLLNAYACISTGVKLSVSNQVPKGKKTIAFSTNHNPNTKENIANVYGTKTLLALIPLNLKFEMEASTRPGATQSAEDACSREIRIVGHISRPVVGEGRQTPDRQMFFVNSRPCNMPQLAKAFNEVYKSYNVTQSPFIFADLKLDTNAYDVNVSPDKRTILLHDQTALLESLKTALGDLFAMHDQSVPQAQLLGRKFPTFKPPTIQPRESTDSVSEDLEAPSKSAEIDEPQPDVVKPTSATSSVEIPQRGFVKASLIERFADRDTEERVSRPTLRRKRNLSLEKIDDPRLVEQETENLVEDQSERETSPMPTIPTISEQSLKAVEDFNARVASQQAKKVNRERIPILPHPAAEQAEEEESIAAITQTPLKRTSQSTIQNAFDRMRPMRTPAQQATITVGDTTTVTTVGSQSLMSRRARIHTPKFALNGTLLNQTPKRPLFMKSLRGFAAPGTQTEESDEEDEEEGEADADASPDSSMLHAHIRSPSPHKHIIGSSTDDVFESSDPTPPLPVEEEDKEEVPRPTPDGEDDGSDDEYIDESEKKALEDAKIAKMISEAEETAARPTEMNLKRAKHLFQLSSKKYTTINIRRTIDVDVTSIARHIRNLEESLQQASAGSATGLGGMLSSAQLDPEERLSLTVSKSDFDHMRIIGQFNLGFILAVRPPTLSSPRPELFIIDQHASDEKYNFERFSTSTMLVSQRLVHPHPLELTAIEEEVILGNEHALTANGFVVEMDTTGDATTGQRAKLTSLPMSKEVTFTPRDLEELLALLIESPPSSSLESQYIPRPSKVRKLLASRACRSSVMVGKTLRTVQMENIVRHMGSMDKPWSCPHGRPTMRHLFGLEKWEGWREGDGVSGLEERRETTDWGTYLRHRRE
ncbi:DNA mismatch repair protein MutL [Melanomma pulvis-pyrius CBS 109.77]|uniref:DNA mismatch repair protein PMS1 n=1 Tax=Melanomma pulvis-pyrius CBS 109.77 TaxID=1314802 RepID=A0A6A6X154_9PLEO|nr:DNA mismatch repair protein MutL [Melanomma pulvis-pyrius CBS 109.77]